jgi:D-arabinose 5-phosphate isomerase GutQ
MPESLKFAATISSMGRHKIVIIPKALHTDAKKFEGKQVIVTISEL